LGPVDPGWACIDFCKNAALTRVRDKRPVAFLVSESGEPLQLRMPSTGRVLATWEANDALCFAVTRRQQPFSVPSASPFVQMISAAESALTHILVVDPLFDGAAAYVAPWLPLEQPPCGDDFTLDTGTLTAIDAREACVLYRSIFDEEAMPPYERGLPFRFSAGGCDTIAQAVARRFENRGLVVGKAWAFSKRRRVMTIQVSSRRGCRQDWWFHVAVVVRQRGANGLWVFDPNSRLEQGVTTLDDWKRDFGPNLGPLHLTTAKAYFHGCDHQSACDIQHPCFSTGDDAQLDEELKIYRCALGCLSRVEGCPPHECPGSSIQLPDCGNATTAGS